jgi:hypothetical protein
MNTGGGRWIGVPFRPAPFLGDFGRFFTASRTLAPEPGASITSAVAGR